MEWHERYITIRQTGGKMYPIIVGSEPFKILCDCTMGCKRCGREFGGSHLPDEVNLKMRDLHTALLDIRHLAENAENIEKIKLLTESAISYYDAASKRLRNPPKYKLVFR